MKKIFLTIIIVSVLGLAGFYFKNYWLDSTNSIEDFVDARDTKQVNQLFRDDWFLMICDENSKTYDIDFMLQNRTSSQRAKLNDLVIKVWRENNEVAGFLAYYKKSLYRWHLLFLIVNKKYRGQGRSKKLLKFAVDDMVARGALRVDLATRSVNKLAQSVYESFGFKLVHSEGKYYDYAWFKTKA
jgi:ribosomal protein S18 acetylase RimI-like enzyme